MGPSGLLKKVLVIAAHPDDEILGCGGTIAKHVRRGDEVSFLFLADGVTSRLECESNDLVERESMSKLAAECLGVTSVFSFQFPDNMLDSVPLLDVVKKIEEVLETTQSEVVYTHFGNDLNIDHEIVNQATLTACRPIPDQTVKEIYCYEVLSSTNWSSSCKSSFTPNLFIDISDTYKIKEESLKFYDEEMRAYPHSRSYRAVKALAEYRGSSVGVEFAEAMYIERLLQ